MKSIVKGKGETATTTAITAVKATRNGADVTLREYNYNFVETEDAQSSISSADCEGWDGDENGYGTDAMLDAAYVGSGDSTSDAPKIVVKKRKK